MNARSAAFATASPAVTAATAATAATASARDDRSSRTVEVVLCTYNGARYIAEQLQSIARQSRPVDVVCIYDDGSTDDTLDVLERCGALFDAGRTAFRVTRNPVNLGYVQNFATALANATCDMVAFCDQDDVWEPEKIERLLGRLQGADADLAFSDGVVIDADSARVDAPSVLDGYGLTAGRDAAFDAAPWSTLLGRNYINGAAMIVRRTSAQAALPIPSGFPHDYWLALWIARTGRVVRVSDVLYRYRIHQTNTIGAAALPLRHQLQSIWRNPSAPRDQEVARTRQLLARLPTDDAHRAEVVAKLDWLTRVHVEPSRLRRLAHIVGAWLDGSYRRFGHSHALMRDLVGAVRPAVSRRPHVR